MNDTKKNLFKGLLGIYVYLFFNFGAYDILKLIGIDGSKLSESQVVLVSTIFSTLILVILILISRKKFIQNFKDFLKKNITYFKRNAKYWGLSLLGMMICNLLISLIFKTTTSANDETVRTLFNSYPIYIFLSAVIIAPFTEELVFRQSIRYLIKNNVLFIIVSGLVFGFMHILSSMSTLADILYIIPYSIPGFAFAYMLTKEDNVMVPISFHLIHNGLSMALLILAKMAGAM